MFHGLQTFPAKFVSYQMKIFRLLQVLDRFMKRKRLTARRITTSGNELSRDALIQISQFLAECEPYMQMDFDFVVERRRNFHLH
jgi:hypothetical protein